MSAMENVVDQQTVEEFGKLTVSVQDEQGGRKPKGPRKAIRPKLQDDKITLIIRSIRKFDAVEKDIKFFARRVQERYGGHFPELANIVQDGVLYVKTVKMMGSRANAAGLNFSKILPGLGDVEAELKEAARTSSGTEDCELDLSIISPLCHAVVHLSKSREKFHDYLRSEMNAVAPNLTALVGELVGARLIARAGGMVNLVKMHMSRIQILGGVIYGATLIKQAAPAKLKSRMARSLAAKIALAIRHDVFGSAKDNSYGVEGRAKLEKRLWNLEAAELGRHTADHGWIIVHAEDAKDI